MKLLSGTDFRCACLLLVAALAGACAQPALRKDMVREGPVTAPADFNGSWEMDYTRSDDVNQKLTELFRKLSDPVQSRSAQSESRSRSFGISNPSRTVESIVALARLADEITASQVLEINQDPSQIRVDRQDDYALICGFFTRGAQVVETPFGTELCGWDGDQLVFHANLADGLTISHRLTLAPDGQKMHIATRVASTVAPAAFTLSRFYDRFEPFSSDYDCTYTLSRQRVCTPRRNDQ